MEECIYRKMICSAGHESRVYAPEEPLPRRCPVCNQPYDRRLHRPVLCFADGSVPGRQESVLSAAEEPARLVREEPAAAVREVSETAVPGEYESAGAEGYAVSGIPGMRGRRMPVPDAGQAEGFRRGRTESPAHQRPVREAGMRQTGMRQTGTRQTAYDSQISGFVLYSGGSRIEVPQHGCFLGREETGEEIFAMNLLVSRKHAFVEPVRDSGTMRLRVQDAGSLNGTFADAGDGRRQLQPGEEILLAPGSRLWLANQILVIKEDKS